MFTGLFMILLFSILSYSKPFENEENAKESSQVEVRAVFINCQIDEKHQYGNEVSRFQREELFKHNALRDCKMKLALTVKMTSDSSHSSSDEYIPIEHVFDGINKKRVRLLNPYILRLRREAPFEAYKLHELDIFSGVLTTSNEKSYQRHSDGTNNRLIRNVNFIDKEDWIVSKQNNDETNIVERCPIAEPFYRNNNGRQKRHDLDTNIQNNPFEEIIKRPAGYHKTQNTFNYNNNKIKFNTLLNTDLEEKNVTGNLKSENVMNHLEGTVKNFHLYEVVDPNILFKAQIQLLEKLSTPEGKTVWKDLTKQESARYAVELFHLKETQSFVRTCYRINSLCPEWTNEEVNIRYRCAERIPKEDFTLPPTGICLLLPQNGRIDEGFSSDKLGDFIIVPFEDLEPIEENDTLHGSHENSSITGAAGSKQLHRHILVRLSRALFGRNEDNFAIVNEDSGRYLTIPYRQPHHAQIEIEAKADDNQLVYVGSSGRLTTAVSESTRRTRTILTVQVTNTGLAAARLRPKIRECAPELSRFNEDDIGGETKPILIPPMHTHKFCLEIPLDMSGDIAHCSVALLNDADESVAVRDVRIKRGDRCFCVWHCQCVCLNEDPQLLCQEMAEYQQVAAGLARRERPRTVRAACYPDVVSINLLVIAFGVVLLLLVLGLLKACLGLFIRCVGSWGIDQLLQTPRRLDCYYEPSLRSRPVVYDEEGWPVHPDTMKRTVRLISKPMEFILNTIFFVTWPCLMLWNSIKQIISRYRNNPNKDGSVSKTKKCISPQEMQDTAGTEAPSRWRGRRRRRPHTRWMSPQAEQLSTDIWRNGLAPQGFTPPDCMRPLLREDRFQGNKLYKLNSPVIDSEQDDTEYVLMQMQNSRETLSKDLQQLRPSFVRN